MFFLDGKYTSESSCLVSEIFFFTGGWQKLERFALGLFKLRLVCLPVNVALAAQQGSECCNDGQRY